MLIKSKCKLCYECYLEPSAKPITILPSSRQREAVESGSLAAERADRNGTRNI